MTKRASAAYAVAIAMLMIGAACGGSDGDTSQPAQGDAETDTVEDDTADDEETPDEDDSSSDTTVGFGELIEGSFVLTGAVEERYDVGDDQYGFRVGGGCEGSAFGFSVQVNDAAVTTTFATFEALADVELSGGVTGEFDAVDFEATVFADGNTSLAESYSGPVKMIISEHDTGGADADLNARRMTVTLLGSVPSDSGEVDVDITFRWVMGCP